jgi:hypothetical protein
MKKERGSQILKATTISHTAHGTDKPSLHHFRKAFRTTSLSCSAICFSAKSKSKTCSVPQWGQGCRFELRLRRTISNSFSHSLQLIVFSMGKIHFISGNGLNPGRLFWPRRPPRRVSSRQQQWTPRSRSSRLSPDWGFKSSTQPRREYPTLPCASLHRNHQESRVTFCTSSKCLSRESNGSLCWSASAAIQTSFSGIIRPRPRKSATMSA